MTHGMLYIEDDENNVRLIERLLARRAHVDLRVAMTGREGVQAARTEPAALILLDNHLPDATGTEVLSQLAADPDTAAIPVVILSGDTDQGTISRLLAAGAADYLEKPFDIHQLGAILDRYFP